MAKGSPLPVFQSVILAFKLRKTKQIDLLGFLRRFQLHERMMSSGAARLARTSYGCNQLPPIF